MFREWEFVAAVVGGDSYFLPYLAAFLGWKGVTPLLAFRREETRETKDGKSGREVDFGS